MKKFYNGMNEYRLEKLTSTQGQYPLCKDLTHALKKAKFRASNSSVPWTVQLWKPKKGKLIYIVLPNSFKNVDKGHLVAYFKVKGYDVSHIMQKKYVITKRKV